MSYSQGAIRRQYLMPCSLYRLRSRGGFTLMEVMATLLLLSFGLASVVGMVLYSQRISAEFQDKSTAMLTAQSALVDSDLLAGTTAASEGALNGYYVYRTEVADTVVTVDSAHEWVTITVHIYAGQEDRYLTSIRRRLLRRTVAP